MSEQEKSKLNVLTCAADWKPHPDLSGIWCDKKHVTMNWGGYEYPIRWDRISDEAHLLSWVRHLSEKSWMNGLHVSMFIEFVMREKGWKRRSL